MPPWCTQQPASPLRLPCQGLAIQDNAPAQSSWLVLTLLYTLGLYLSQALMLLFAPLWPFLRAVTVLGI
jgi:hypothetical protein